MSSSEIRTHPDRVRRCFYVDSLEEANEWISILMRCTLPFEFLRMFHFLLCIVGEPLFNNSPEHAHALSQFPKVKGSVVFLYLLQRCQLLIVDRFFGTSSVRWQFILISPLKKRKRGEILNSLF